MTRAARPSVGRHNPKAAAARQEDSSDIDAIFPALAFAFDGRVYVNMAGFKQPERFEGRRLFVGWELKPLEFSWELAAGRKLGELEDVVFATDGKFYGGPARVPAKARDDRHMFRGAPLRARERKVAFTQMDGLAAVITKAVDTSGRDGT